MQDFHDWTRAVPAVVFDLHKDLSDLQRAYAGLHPRLFGNVVELAMRRGGRSVLAEFRYIDADYRSEHTAFYSTTYRRYPSITHRLHFFNELLPDEVIDVTRPSTIPSKSYLGYSVMRPVDTSAVGRTAMLPPAELESHVTCLAPHGVNLFGSDLTIEAAPFMGQDSQLNVCVHVAAWVCAHYHHRRFGEIPRWVASDMAGFAPMDASRALPSPGLTVRQLVTILDSVGLPPIMYDLGRLPVGESMPRIVCRYLDSGLPVIVAADRHAFVLVGYRWVADEEDESRRRIQFIRQDDLQGGYQIVPNYLLDSYRPWRHLAIPLPTKLYMSGEGAEKLGRKMLRELLEQGENSFCEEILTEFDEVGVDKKYVLRTSAHLSNEFKAKLPGRRSDVVAGIFQWHPLPRWVWIVELVEKQLWFQNKPSVVAEVLIDATGHAQSRQVLAWRVPGEAGRIIPDLDVSKSYKVPDVDPQPSVVKSNTNTIPFGV